MTRPPVSTLTCLILVCGAAWASAMPRPQETAGGILSVSTIPPTLEVYLAAEDEVMAEARDDGEETLAPMLRGDTFALGTAPAKLELAAGSYLLAVKPVPPMGEDGIFWARDPGLEFEELVLVERPDGALDGAAIYRLEFDPEQRDTLVVLGYPLTASASEVEAFYPDGPNFGFDDEDLVAAIDDDNIDALEIQEALELLHRGGKAVLRYGFTGITPSGNIGRMEIRTVVEIVGLDRWEISRSVSYPSR